MKAPAEEEGAEGAAAGGSKRSLSLSAFAISDLGFSVGVGGGDGAKPDSDAFESASKPWFIPAGDDFRNSLGSFPDSRRILSRASRDFAG
jgi:hypothetical protein